MNPITRQDPDAALQRLVHALVMWGATASQIVTHMEQSKRSGASRSQASTVDAFAAVVSEIAAPVVAARRVALDQLAEAIEAIDAEVCEQVLLVPLAAPNRAARRRRGGH
ncbi:MAG: hypothetical protein ABUL67_03990 [Haliangium ochraceum]